RFTVEQIAGDLLPGASLSQKVATGFHRNTMTNEEGGIDVEEFRFASVVDRVGTTGTVWLGLTVQCAQCHTHKFDPITHRDTYRLEFPVPDGRFTPIRLETSSDPKAKDVGPGRTKHGNFVVSEFTARLDGKPVAIAAATADIEQPEFPASLAIDGNPKANGWA